jgi:uncharacterized protein (DUF1499 family)
MERSLGFLAIGCILIVAATTVLLFTPLGDRPLSAIFPVGDLKPIAFRNLKLARKPNQFLMCPPGYCDAKAHANSIEFEVPIDRLRERWQELMASQPRVTLLAEHKELQCDYVQRSARFRFPDIITVRFIPLSPSRSTLAIYSRSVYGSRDFGVNESRVEEWMALITSTL